MLGKRWDRWVLGLLLATALLWLTGGTARAATFDSAYSPEEQSLLEAYQAGTLIRLHIVAENDSPTAQQVKLKVRDALLRAFGQELEAEDPNALFLQLQANQEAMRQVAEDTARSLGFTGSVTAQVGVLTLPPKEYGRVLLPEGPYRALRITLGQGQGKNWWCVLYPSLCLAVAGDDPWTAQGAEPVGETAEEDAAADAMPADATPTQPPVLWDTEQLFCQWLAWPELGR